MMEDRKDEILEDEIIEDELIEDEEEVEVEIEEEIEVEEEEVDEEVEDEPTNESNEEVEALKRALVESQIKNLMLAHDIPAEYELLIMSETVEEADEKIKLFKQLHTGILVDESYKPADKKNEDKYSKAINSKDVKSALLQKFNLLG